MTKFATLKAGAAPFALSLAMISSPALAQNAAPAAAAEPVAESGTIIVTGSRIQNPNMTSISPVTVVGAAEVKAQGNVRVEDLLNSLPQVFANEGATDSNGASGIATVDLRDLGTSRTLVLVNGRRLGPGDPADIAADLNFIPGSLIQRVDVLTGGASATYGSDALAGVVNFILNTNFEGVQLDAQYSFYNHKNDFVDPFKNDTGNFTANCLGQPAYNCQLAARNFQAPKGNTTDGAAKNVTLTIGAGFDDGRGHVTAYAGWRKVNAITQGDRDFSYCGYSAGTTSGSNYYTCGGSSTSAVGRFRRTQNVGLGATPVYAPFNPLADGSCPFPDANACRSFTANPAATPAVPGGFANYSGTRDGFNFNPYNFFVRPDERYTFGAFANYEINDSFKPYLEVMFMDDRTVAQIAPSGAFYGTDFFVNCNNPLLSAAQATQLCGAAAGTPTLQSLYIGRRNVEGGGRISDIRHTDYRVVAGTKGNITDAISYDVYGQFYRAVLASASFNDFSRRRINNALNVVTNAAGQPVCASATPNAAGIVTDPLCVPYNIFTAGGVTPAAVNYLQVPGFQKGQSDEYIASGSVSIDLGKMGAKLPWAADGIQMAIGGEYRKEHVTFQNDVEFATGDLAGIGAPFGIRDTDGQFNVKEVFGEISVPIVSDRPFFHQLGLNAGYRYSSYSLAGSTDAYKVGLDWAPVEQVRFRAGYNRAVRAPNTVELFSTPNVVLFAGKDPCAGATPSATLAQCLRTGVTAAQYGTIDANPAAQYNQRTAGNINLTPETGDTYTVGVVLNPIRNLTVTVDGFDIRVKNQIGVLGANFQLGTCINSNVNCASVQRAPGGSLFTGTGFVDNPTVNLPGTTKTRGIDLTALYRMDLFGGGLTFDLVGTYLDKFRNGTGVSCEGRFGPSSCGTPLPQWRHKLRVGYTLENGIGFSAAWRYFHKVKNELFDTGITTCPPAGNPAGCINPAVARIKSQSYFDLSMTAKIADHYTFRIGAQNLLDKNPPVLDTNYTNNGSNTYAQVYDSLGRYIYAAIQLDF